MDLIAQDEAVFKWSDLNKQEVELEHGDDEMEGGEPDMEEGEREHLPEEE